MLDTTWKLAETANNAIVWYLTYNHSLEAFQTLKTAKNGQMRLPYTETMLTRRQERGGDVPANWRAEVFTIAETETTHETTAA